jgi:hypothetical protein
MFNDGNSDQQKNPQEQRATNARAYHKLGPLA